MFKPHRAGTLTKQLLAFLDALAWMAACLHKAQVPSSQTGAIPTEDVCIAAKALHTLFFLHCMCVALCYCVALHRMYQLLVLHCMCVAGLLCCPAQNVPVGGDALHVCFWAALLPWTECTSCWCCTACVLLGCSVALHRMNQLLVLHCVCVAGLLCCPPQNVPAASAALHVCCSVLLCCPPQNVPVFGAALHVCCWAALLPSTECAVPGGCGACLTAFSGHEAIASPLCCLLAYLPSFGKGQ